MRKQRENNKKDKIRVSDKMDYISGHMGWAIDSQ